MESSPSPTKRASITRPEVPPADPLDTRGSFSRQASSGLNDLAARVVEASTRGRMTVGIGQSRGIFNDLSSSSSALPPRRQLAATQSLPSLPYASSSRPIFQSSRETTDAVFSYNDVRRANELQPMWATGVTSPVSREPSGVFSIESDGFRTRDTTVDMEGEMMEDSGGDGDGFDMDEVFASSSSSGPRGLALDEDLDNDAEPESQSSSGTTATITRKLKRALEEEPEERGGEDSDDGMEDTEDEEQDEVPNLALRAPIGRPIARKGLVKTRSLPAHVFSGDVNF
ncbi:hypothetical protein P7C70_g7714, partial [Phenoliferia sp. Uapishka_3]